MSIFHQIRTVAPVSEKPKSPPKRAPKPSPVAPVSEKPAGRPAGRPKSDARKEQISIRLDPRIIAHYRSLGEGWQAKLNEDLLALIKPDQEGTA